MIARLELVKGMELNPNECVLCANNPLDEITGKQQEAIFAPGVDVNWGNSVYICMSCAQIIADLIGRVPVEGFDNLKAKFDALDEEHTELVEQHAKARKLLERVADGKRATREVKAQSKPKAKKKAKA